MTCTAAGQCEGGTGKQGGEASEQTDRWHVGGILAARRRLLEVRGERCGWERGCAGNSVVDP